MVVCAVAGIATVLLALCFGKRPEFGNALSLACCAVIFFLCCQRYRRSWYI